MAGPQHVRGTEEQGLHERARRGHHSLPADITYIRLPLQISKTDRGVVWEEWPFVLPYDMVAWTKDMLSRGSGYMGFGPFATEAMVPFW